MTLPQAACLLIVAKTGRILTVTRRNSDIFGLPGGKVDPGETPFMTAKRETLEETGLMIVRIVEPLLYRGECEAGADGKAFDCSTFLIEANLEFELEPVERGIIPAWHSWDELLAQPVFTKYNTAVFERYMDHVASKNHPEIML